MTSTDPVPDMLPGRSAYGWQRVFEIETYASVPVYVLCFLAVIFASRGANFEGVFGAGIGGFGVLTVISLIILVRFNGRLKAERLAGYTTVWKSEPTLPQLDAKTGELIRRAGDAYVKRSDWTRGDQPDVKASPAAESASTREQKHAAFWATSVSWLPLFIFEGVVIGAVLGFVFDRNDLAFGMLEWTLATIAAIAAVIAVCALVVRGRLARLAAAAPPDFTFAFANSKEYADGFLAVTGTVPAALGYFARGASADTKGLTLWHGKPPTEVARLDWSRVSSIQADSVPGSSNSRDLLVLVAFTDEDDTVATLPLAYPKVNSFPVPSRPDVRRIVAQLNQLRTAHQTPRSRVI